MSFASTWPTLWPGPLPDFELLVCRDVAELVVGCAQVRHLLESSKIHAIIWCACLRDQTLVHCENLGCRVAGVPVVFEDQGPPAVLPSHVLVALRRRHTDDVQRPSPRGCLRASRSDVCVHSVPPPFAVEWGHYETVRDMGVVAEVDVGPRSRNHVRRDDAPQAWNI